jgi:hypothetical protein
MVQRIYDNSHSEADGINVASSPVIAHSFSSGNIQAVSEAKPGNKRNTILTYVT